MITLGTASLSNSDKHAQKSMTSAENLVQKTDVRSWKTYGSRFLEAFVTDMSSKCTRFDQSDVNSRDYGKIP